MSKITVSVDVEKEMLDLGKSVFGLLKVIESQLKDGFQPGQDLPAIAVEALKDIPVVMANLSSVGIDWKEDQAAFLLALGVAYEQTMVTA